MRCEELRILISDYLDGELDVEVCAEFERHVAHCDRCQIVIRTTRRTISIYRQRPPQPVPDETARRLREALRALWEKSLDF